MDKTLWEMDVAERTGRLDGRPQRLPAHFGPVQAFFEHGRITVEAPAKGVRLQCSAPHETCTLTLSGTNLWRFRLFFLFR